MGGGIFSPSAPKGGAGDDGSSSSPTPSIVIKIVGKTAGLIIGFTQQGVQILKKPTPESDALLDQILTCVKKSGKSPSDWFLCAKRIANEQGLKIISNL